MARIVGTLGGTRLTGTAEDDFILGHPELAARTTAPSFETVASGLGQALSVTAAPGDSAHLYVADKLGAVRIVDPSTGAVNERLFIDVRGEVDSQGERGLIGMTFHPDYWQNGKVYVAMSRLDGPTEIREYKVDLDRPDQVIAGSGRTILLIPQGTATNHKGGWLDFGPDGLLYFASGDGGPSNDPTGTGQNPNDLLGAMLRIDVGGDDFPGDPSRNYAIPSGNPFADGVGGAPEVWAYGLRNPFRNSFDRGTGDLWIADVGEGGFEEVDIGAPGANYGWSAFEGPGGPAAGFTFPVFSYAHAEGVGSSITGGYVSRGADSGLFGQYVFGDFVSGRIWTLADFDGDGVLDRRQLDDGSTFGPGRLTSFGEDGDGTLYAVGIDGTLRVLSGGAATGRLDGDDVIRPRLGDDRVFAGAGDDRIVDGGGDDLLSGMEGNDFIQAGIGDDLAIGGRGRDKLLGFDGRDTLLGGFGNDRLDGQRGADLLIGGSGADSLEGGGGADRFRWTTREDSLRGGRSDQVVDFSRAEGDALDLSALADGRFTLVGARGFAPTGAQVSIVRDGDAQRVNISLDGGPRDMEILVYSETRLTSDDFIL